MKTMLVWHGFCYIIVFISLNVQTNQHVLALKAKASLGKVVVFYEVQLSKKMLNGEK